LGQFLMKNPGQFSVKINSLTLKAIPEPARSPLSRQKNVGKGGEAVCPFSDGTNTLGIFFASNLLIVYC
ncbi:hypothetical protein, partial [Komagataeibacter sucrofermentans]|uniref:hypothetical protein n=1 Tax=Komagataeibacter sucrofermentans TaxID=1053551 RepID=UPI00222F9F96